MLLLLIELLFSPYQVKQVVGKLSRRERIGKGSNYLQNVGEAEEEAQVTAGTTHKKLQTLC